MFHVCKISTTHHLNPLALLVRNNGVFVISIALIRRAPQPYNELPMNAPDRKLRDNTEHEIGKERLRFLADIALPPHESFLDKNIKDEYKRERGINQRIWQEDGCTVSLMYGTHHKCNGKFNTGGYWMTVVRSLEWIEIPSTVSYLWIEMGMG